MTTRVATQARHRVSIRTLIANGLVLAAAAVLVYLLIRIGLAATSFGDAAASVSAGALVLSAVTYLAGHAFRILRLALLIGGWRTGFREIASVHLMTAAVSLALPLKLGEIYRIYELSRIAGGGLRSLLIVWCERLFDTAVILLLLLIALVATPAASNYAMVAIIAGAFLAVSAIVFFLVPENLRRLSVLIIRRYDSPRTVPVLRAVETVRRSILAAPSLVQDKLASLATLTILIWTCEIVCFAIVLSPLHTGLAQGLDALLSFLSAITTGDTFDYLIATTKDGARLAYLGATQAPLVAFGFVAAFYCIARRFRK